MASRRILTLLKQLNCRCNMTGRSFVIVVTRRSKMLIQEDNYFLNYVLIIYRTCISYSLHLFTLLNMFV